MYEGPVVYESQVIDYFAIFMITFVVLSIFSLMFVSLGKIFQKSEQKFWTAFIPFYNVFCLLRVANLSNLYFLLLLIPGVNLFAIYKINKQVAVSFKKEKSFVWGLIFLPFIFYPILAFSQDRYIGINEEKVEEVVIQDFVREKVEPVEVSTVIKSDDNVNVGTSSAVITNTDGVLKADTSILEQKKPLQVEYMECPECKNKVKKGAPVCFICGHKF